MKAALRLVRWLQARYHITTADVIGHSMANHHRLFKDLRGLAQRSRRLAGRPTCAPSGGGSSAGGYDSPRLNRFSTSQWCREGRGRLRPPCAFGLPAPCPPWKPSASSRSAGAAGSGFGT